MSLFRRMRPAVARFLWPLSATLILPLAACAVGPDFSRRQPRLPAIISARAIARSSPVTRTIRIGGRRSMTPH